MHVLFLQPNLLTCFQIFTKSTICPWLLRVVFSSTIPFVYGDSVPVVLTYTYHLIQIHHYYLPSYFPYRMCNLYICMFHSSAKSFNILLDFHKMLHLSLTHHCYCFLQYHLFMVTLPQYFWHIHTTVQPFPGNALFILFYSFLRMDNVLLFPKFKNSTFLSDMSVTLQSLFQNLTALQIYHNDLHSYCPYCMCNLYTCTTCVTSTYALHV